MSNLTLLQSAISDTELVIDIIKNDSVMLGYQLYAIDMSYLIDNVNALSDTEYHRRTIQSAIESICYFRGYGTLVNAHDGKSKAIIVENRKGGVILNW